MAWSVCVALVALVTTTAMGATMATEAVAIPAARIAQVSEALLGRPYAIDPLGEGPAGSIDRDPLWRTDAFDCLTFIETVIALARSADADGARDSLRQIRYADGIIDFARRNHFPDADWIPNNLRVGGLRDVTAQLATRLGDPTLLAHTHGVVHRARWITALPHNPMQATNPLLHPPSIAVLAQLRDMAALSSDQPVDIAYLRVRELSPKRLREVVDALPDGVLLFIVRPNTSMVGPVGAVTQLSHVGFVLRDAHHVVQFRNASSGRAQRVIDAPLLQYLMRMQVTRSFAGVLVFQVLAPR